MDQDNRIKTKNLTDVTPCIMCGRVNYYFRIKILPCKNKECEFSKAEVMNICNQCIRDIQRGRALCPHCNKRKSYTDSFGHYRFPYVYKFEIGLVSLKNLQTKTYQTLENGTKIHKGSFDVIPTIGFSIINIKDQNQASLDQITQGKALLQIVKQAQVFEVELLDQQKNNSNLTPNSIEVQKQIYTSYFLNILHNTCKQSVVSCGANQIFINGGFTNNSEYIHGMNMGNNQINQFHARSQQLWIQYSKGEIQGDVLQNGILNIQNEYKQLHIQKNPQDVHMQLPFSYPYINNSFLLNFTFDQDNQEFNILQQPYLLQSRAYHQTVVTPDRIFVLGGFCNGFVLNSIESARIQRNISSCIESIDQFQNISDMSIPRANFSTVYKPGVYCTSANCKFTKQEASANNQSYCNSPLCHNHEYIYICGGQTKYAEHPTSLTLARYDIFLNSYQDLQIAGKNAQIDNFINSFIGFSIGLWNDDLFIFGGQPLNSKAAKQYPKAGFFTLKLTNIPDFEKIVEVDLISKEIAYCYLPSFTVSIPLASESQAEKEISSQYRLFVIQAKLQNSIKFCTHRIQRYEGGSIQLDSQGNAIRDKDGHYQKNIKDLPNSKNGFIYISPEMQEEKQNFSFLAMNVVDQKFLEEQSFCLINTTIDK